MVRRIVAFVVAVLIPEAVGAVAAVATQSSVTTWYPTLTKPWFTPPDVVFAPVWISLYAIMGIASWLVWTRGPRRATVQMALAAYAIQLVLNGAWSIVFFGFQSIGGGLIVILLLLIALGVTLRRFRQCHRWAGWLLWPYLAWVAYATALNAALLWLNGW
ncbi:MAG: tryptophan-rich sensory protein [Bacteroidetes bacterium]|jgi:tryptophan-rich sensory protein|nr:tryptophan-rich sensory protein [Bacteroidota bacterium]